MTPYPAQEAMREPKEGDESQTFFRWRETVTENDTLPVWLF